MNACQDELRRAVIKRCRLPRGCRVARLAILTEIPGDVIRIGRSRKIGCVTLGTIGVYQRVIVVRMARLALQGRVFARQCEFGGIVVERRAAPRRR